MNTLSHWLIRCYPAQWQERYAQEFMALLAQQPLTLSDAIDILRAAYDEHRRTPASKGAMPGLRLATAGVLAGLSWCVLLAVALLSTAYPQWQGALNGLLPANAFLWLASQALWTAAVCGWLWRSQARHAPAL